MTFAGLRGLASWARAAGALRAMFAILLLAFQLLSACGAPTTHNVSGPDVTIAGLMAHDDCGHSAPQSHCPELCLFCSIPATPPRADMASVIAVPLAFAHAADLAPNSSGLPPRFRPPIAHG
jgi:hypothetical protein